MLHSRGVNARPSTRLRLGGALVFIEEWRPVCHSADRGRCASEGRSRRQPALRAARFTSSDTHIPTITTTTHTRDDTSGPVAAARGAAAQSLTPIRITRTHTHTRTLTHSDACSDRCAGRAWPGRHSCRGRSTETGMLPSHCGYMVHARRMPAHAHRHEANRGKHKQDRDMRPTHERRAHM